MHVLQHGLLVGEIYNDEQERQERLEEDDNCHQRIAVARLRIIVRIEFLFIILYFDSIAISFYLQWPWGVSSTELLNVAK